MQHFESYEQLWEYATGVLMGDIEPIDLTLSEDFNFRVRISGDSWDGYIDHRVADIVKELQNTAELALSEINSLLPAEEQIACGKDAVLIKTKVKKGCTEIEAKWGEQYYIHIKGIKRSTVVFLGCLGVLGILGYGVSNCYFEFKSATLQQEVVLAQQENDAERLRQTSNLMDAAERILAITEEPNRTAIRVMEKADNIKFGNSEQKLTKAQASEYYPRRSHPVSDTFYVDDIYEIDEVKQTKEMLRLVIPGVCPFTASIADLNGQDVSTLYQELEDAKQNKRPAKLSLQVTTKVKEGKPHNAKVVGVGTARGDALGLATVVKEKPILKAKKKDRSESDGMLSMMDFFEPNSEAGTKDDSEPE